MLQLIWENLSTIVVAAVVIAAFVGACVLQVKGSARQKKSGCGCGCSSCPNHAICHKGEK